MPPRKTKAPSEGAATPTLKTAANQQKRVLRAAFVRHLERICVGGHITEAAFHGNYAVNALTVDQLLMVMTAGLPDAPKLTAEIGIVDVPLVAKAARLLSDAEDKASLDLAVYVQDHRLVLDDSPRGVQRLVTSAPASCNSYLEPETVAELQAALPDSEPLALDKSVLARIVAAFTLYKAEQLTLDFSKAGKVTVRVGGAETHAADFTLAAPAGLEEFGELLFTSHLKDVFATLLAHGGDAPAMKCSSQALLIEDEGYTYMVSARMRPAEDVPSASEEEPIQGVE